MFFASPSNDLYQGHDSSFLPCIGCWGVSCPMYSEFLIDATAPRRKWRRKRKGKVPLLPSVFHNCPRPPPVCGLPLLCSVSWVFPFCRINPSSARSLGWKPPVASETQEKNSSYGASMEPAMSGGPRTCQRWSVALPTTMLLGTRLPWRDCSMPTDGCFWGAFLRKLRLRELKWISQGHTGSSGGKSIPVP